MAVPAVVALTSNFSARSQARSRSAPLSQPKHRCAPAHSKRFSRVRIHSPSGARETASQNLTLSQTLKSNQRNVLEELDAGPLECSLNRHVVLLYMTHSW